MTKETIRQTTTRGIKIHLYQDHETYLIDISQIDQHSPLELEPLAAGTNIQQAIKIFETTLQYLDLSLDPMFLYSMVATLILKELYGIAQPIVINQHDFFEAISSTPKATHPT